MQFCSILAEVWPTNNCVQYLGHFIQIFQWEKKEKKKGCLIWVTQVCMILLPGRNRNATSWLFQYLGAHCIIHLACCTASPFWWTSRLIQHLGVECVIHFQQRVARSLLKATKGQKQWKVYTLGPTSDLWKYRQLTIYNVQYTNIYAQHPKISKDLLLSFSLFSHQQQQR